MASWRRAGGRAGRGRAGVRRRRQYHGKGKGKGKGTGRRWDETRTRASTQQPQGDTTDHCVLAAGHLEDLALERHVGELDAAEALFLGVGEEVLWAEGEGEGARENSAA